MTDKELEQIYQEAYRAVYWTAMSLLKNEEEAQDIVQDTFVTLIESYDTLKDKSKVVPWLKKIAANKCLNRLARTRTVNVGDEFLETMETVPEDFLPEAVVESAENRKIIMDILNESLSEEVRRTLILFYFDEMTTKEIAEALGIPQGTVLWRLNFAKKKIKKGVEKYEKDNNIKLYNVALPFLSLLFMKEAEQVPLRPMPASLTTSSASVKASVKEAGKNASAEAVKKGAGIMMNKIVIGGIGAVAAVAVTAGVIITVLNKPEEKSGQTTRQEVQESVERDSADYLEESSEEISDAESDWEEGSEEAAEPKIIQAASVPEDDIVYISMNGMSAGEVIHNLNNLIKLTDVCSKENYTDRFERVEPYEYYLQSTVMWEFYNSDYEAEYIWHVSFHEEYLEVEFITNEEWAEEIFEYYYPQYVERETENALYDDREEGKACVISHGDGRKYRMQYTSGMGKARFMMNLFFE